MPAIVSEPIGDGHDLARFDCGEPELERWLKASALHAERMRTARTTVWHQGDRRVVAYFALAAHLIRREDLPPRIGRGSPTLIPSILLARLALDRSLHGEGLGEQLLLDALLRGLRASEIAGARLFVVDALHARAATFYEHFGFTRLAGDPYRLVQKVADIAAALPR